MNYFDNIIHKSEAIHLATLDVEMHSHNDQITLGDSQQYYIVWDEASLPIIVTNGKNIRENWDDVMAVAFDTYFVAVANGKAIGIRH